MMKNLNPVALAVLNFARKRKIRGGQTALAQELGCSRVTIYAWIRSGEVSFRFVKRFAELTDCNPCNVNSTFREAVEFVRKEQ